MNYHLYTAKKLRDLATCLAFALCFLGASLTAQPASANHYQCQTFRGQVTTTTTCGDGSHDDTDWGTIALWVGGIVIVGAILISINKKEFVAANGMPTNRLRFSADNFEPTLTYEATDSIELEFAAKRDGNNYDRAFVGLRYEF